MGNTIVIDDGRETFDITNKAGEILGSFSFNPSDTNIIKRYDEIAGSFKNLGSDIPDDADEETLSSVIIAKEAKIKEKLDYMLGYPVSDNFFSIMGAFTPLANGKLYIEVVLDAIASAIEDKTGKRMKKVATSISKYAQKYHK